MRIFLIFIIILIVIVGGITSYFYNKMSYQPEWYVKNGVDNSVDQLLQESYNVKRKVYRTKKQNPMIELSNDEVSSLVLSEVNQKSDIKTEEVVKAVKTKITQEKINIDLILDVNQLHKENFSEQTYQIIEKAKTWIPENMLSDVYLNLKIIPEEQNSVVRLSEKSSISIGGFEFGILDLTDKIGIEKLILQEQWAFSDIQLQKDKLILKH